MFLVGAETRDTTTVISTHIDKIFVMMIVEFILIVFCIRVGEIILVMMMIVVVVRWWGGSDGFDGNDG